MHSDREKVVKHMADRFLRWRLPEDFNPDGGISFKPVFNEHTAHPMKAEPVGTNLFDAQQAEAMARYMLDGAPALSEPVNDDAVAKAWGMLVNGGWTPPSTPSDALSRIISTLTRPAGERPAVAVEALREAERALRPFRNAVFNDNGDITVSGSYNYDEAVAGYFAHRKVEAALTAALGAQTPPEGAVTEAVRKALIFYENHGAGCRLVHSGGDASRNELAKDGGKRAKDALAALDRLNAMKGESDG